MVVGVFPIAKLGALLLRQISKPIANVVKERAKRNPFFRKYVCMPPAQFYNWCEVKSKMWILNLGKPDTVPSLNEEMAIELGANLLGEGIIFVIAAGIIYLEYARQVRKEAYKEEERKEELEDLCRGIRDLAFKFETHDAEIRQIERMIANLDSRVVKFPWNPLSKSEISTEVKVVKISDNQTNTNSSDKKNSVSTKNDGSSINKAVNYVSNELILNNSQNPDKSR